MNTTTNGTGDLTNRVKDMADYDSLPPAVRRVIQDAPIPLGSRSARSLLWKGYNEQETASTIEQFIREGMTSGAIGHTNIHGKQVAGEPWGTVVNWSYTIRSDGWLYKGYHDGRTHPQANKDYPWPNYQVTPRSTTRVVEYYTRPRNETQR